MRFEDLDLLPYYDSRKMDVFNEFFNPVLSNSKIYRRFGGIFSAHRLSMIAEGMQNFIKENNGRVDLVMIPVFSQQDIDALLNGVSHDDIIARNWIDDLSKIKEKILEDHLKAMSWMIANGHLNIKMLLPEHDDGTPLSKSDLRELAIFKKEIGIFFNVNDGAPLSFHGVIDRDDSKVGDLYAIDVSRMWIDSEKSTLKSDHDDFTDYWNEDGVRIGTTTCKIIPLSSKLREYFKSISPKTKAEIPELKKIPVLRQYQTQAIDAWLKNDGRGIFEMATGTGKTFTAIGCIHKIQEKHDKLLVIIAVPYRNLLDQWKKELSKWFMDSRLLNSGNWKQILHDEIYHMNNITHTEMSVIITSHVIFSSKEFVAQIEKCNIPTLLLVDEAHHVGSLGKQNGLSKNYTYRIALSATIERYFDDDGTDALRSYFSGSSNKSTIFDYSLEKAIADGMLCRYNYYPFFIELTPDEMIQYQELTYRAAKLLNSKKPEEQERGERILHQRANIIRDATNKPDCFRKILRQIPVLKHMLVFCSQNQFDVVKSILNDPIGQFDVDRSIQFRKITYKDPPDKKDRTKILNEFANEVWDILLSNKILDEGMDIPQARRCIILASTGNPTQFIQRRGRVLRTYDGKYKDNSTKTHADIYDILVKPQINRFDDQDSIKMEIGIIKSQLSRIRQISDLAVNRQECLEKIRDFTYGLDLED